MSWIHLYCRSNNSNTAAYQADCFLPTCETANLAISKCKAETQHHPLTNSSHDTSINIDKHRESSIPLHFRCGQPLGFYVPTGRQSQNIKADIRFNQAYRLLSSFPHLHSFSYVTCYMTSLQSPLWVEGRGWNYPSYHDPKKRLPARCQLVIFRHSGRCFLEN
jgi:hypothetical protein